MSTRRTIRSSQVSRPSKPPLKSKTKQKPKKPQLVALRPEAFRSQRLKEKFKQNALSIALPITSQIKKQSPRPRSKIVKRVVAKRVKSDKTKEKKVMITRSKKVQNLQESQASIFLKEKDKPETQIQNKSKDHQPDLLSKRIKKSQNTRKNYLNTLASLMKDFASAEKNGKETEKGSNFFIHRGENGRYVKKEKRKVKAEIPNNDLLKVKEEKHKDQTFKKRWQILMDSKLETEKKNKEELHSSKFKSKLPPNEKQLENEQVTAKETKIDTLTNRRIKYLKAKQIAEKKLLASKRSAQKNLKKSPEKESQKDKNAHLSFIAQKSGNKTSEAALQSAELGRMFSRMENRLAEKISEWRVSVVNLMIERSAKIMTSLEGIKQSISAMSKPALPQPNPQVTTEAPPLTPPAPPVPQPNLNSSPWDFRKKNQFPRPQRINNFFANTENPEAKSAEPKNSDEIEHTFTFGKQLLIENENNNHDETVPQKTEKTETEEAIKSATRTISFCAPHGEIFFVHHKEEPKETSSALKSFNTFPLANKAPAPTVPPINNNISEAIAQTKEMLSNSMNFHAFRSNKLSQQLKQSNK